MSENSIKNMKKVSDSQEDFVPLQQVQNNKNAYGTDNHRRAEAVASADHSYRGGERLGLHTVAERGRPSLGNRWDTLVYEEGLWSDGVGDQLGDKKPSPREESDRLIAVAKQVGDYIPSTVWEAFGTRVRIPSAESVVFTDRKNNRVVKFKDPFVIFFKDDSHLEVLYNHHIHNRFFDNSSYRFLGVSQDPERGGVRFVFEQPYINTRIPPSSEDIRKWFEERGFHKTEDGFFYTDGYVSFFDIENNDNCLKDKEGNLYFIDPMIRFEVSAKEAINHYIEHNIKLYNGSRWIQIDENRNDVIIPAARAAIMERAKDSYPHAAFTDRQVVALNKYATLFSDKSSKDEIFTGLIDSMRKEFKSEGIPEGWVKDMRNEAVGLAHGERRAEEKGLKR